MRRRGLLLVIMILLVVGSASLSAGAQEASAAGCAVDSASMTAPDCSLVKSDTGTAADPEPALWGNIECQTNARHALRVSGGDGHPMATGAQQGDTGFRELMLYETDTYASYRCELGRNEHRYGENGGKGTFKLYREGERYITFASYRFLPNSSMAHNTLFQMKQTQPSDNGGHQPILSLKADDGYLVLRNTESPGAGASVSSNDLWKTPIVTGVWTRIALDVTYSQQSDQGRVQVLFDRNGDGDALDQGESSPVLTTHTLKYETPDSAGQANDTDGIAPGESIPSHLRLGMYPRKSSANCSGSQDGYCAIAVDNVQVMKGTSDNSDPTTSPPAGEEPPVDPTTKPPRGNGKNRVKMRASTRSLRSGESLTLTGRLKGARARRRTNRVVIQEWQTGRWRRVMRPRVAARRFKARPRVDDPGQLYLRAKVRGIGRSRSISVDVVG